MSTLMLAYMPHSGMYHYLPAGSQPGGIMSSADAVCGWNLNGYVILAEPPMTKTTPPRPIYILCPTCKETAS